MGKNSNYDNSWMGGMFIRIVVLCLLIVLCIALVTSCSTTKYIDRWHTEYRDSLIYQKVYRDSLIFVPIPLEKNHVITHIGDTSRLETTIAKSVAYVGGDGFLHHTLENKNHKLPIVVSIPSTTLNHGVVNNSNHAITNTVYVEKSLSWWQKFRIGAFWWLLVGLAIALAWILRKPIKTLLMI